MKQKTEKEALRDLVALCSKREVSTFDAKEKLYKWKINATAANEAIEYLHKERYIDDTRFAHAFAKDKFLFSKWGRLKVVQGLRKKMIDADTISDALTVIDDEEYYAMMKDILLKKWVTVSGKTDYERRSHLYYFAIRRGMEHEIVSRFFAERGEHTDDEFDADFFVEGEED